MIEYQTIYGIPGYFNCPFGLGLLSTLCCAGEHRKSKTKQYISAYRRTTCRFCPIGALHSGERTTISSSRIYGSLMCSRCGRVANRLVSGRICVSCYNRERENVAGKNAKGNSLKNKKTYYPITLMVVKPNVIQLRVIDHVLCLSEAIFSVLLSEQESVMFGESESGLFICQE